MLITLYSLVLGFYCIYGHVDYEHPENWNDTDCQNAAEDSPIDILTGNAQGSSECAEEFVWEWEDHDMFQVTNNGHSLDVMAVEIDEVVTADGAEMQYVGLVSDSNTIARFENKFPGHQDEEYCLHSFHFHWGRNSSFGSEHLVNGEHFPLELHFVHFACRYGSIEEANKHHVDSGGAAVLDDYALGVVAVLFDVGETNEAIEKILSDTVLEAVKGHPATETTEGTTVIAANEPDVHASNPSTIVTGLDGYIPDKLIPEDWEDAGWWAYIGSLTTPPCTTIVRWHVLKERAKVSEAQLERFRQLYDDEGNTLSHNWRPTQANTNDLFNCGIEEDDDDDDDDAVISINIQLTAKELLALAAQQSDGDDSGDDGDDD